MLSGPLATRLRVPAPILLVASGAALSLLPAIETVDVAPEVVLYLFLPPLLYHAAFLSAPRESRQDALPITVLAVGLGPPGDHSGPAPAPPAAGGALDEVQEEASARGALLDAALGRLDESSADGEVDDRTAEVFRRLLELRLDRVRAVLGDEGPRGGRRRARVPPRPSAPQLIGAQRDRLRRLYALGAVAAGTMRKLDYGLDLQERRRVSGGA